MKATICLLVLPLFVAARALEPHPGVPPTVAEGAKWEEIHRAQKFFEGPSWDEANGQLWFTAFGKDENDTAILVWSEKSGVAQVWADRTQGTNGTFPGPSGTLLGAQVQTHRIVRYVPQPDGSPCVETVFEDRALHQPNDLCVAPGGTIYFSDPDFRERKRGAVYRLLPGGNSERLPGEIVLPNGIEISADGRTLVVADSATKRWYAYRVGADLPLAKIDPPRVFFDPQVDDSHAAEEGLPDGICLDERGNWYLTGRGGVWCVNPQGVALGFLPVKEFVSNVCFGGSQRRTLFATCQDVVYRIQMTVRGASVALPK
jgi:gluconolactonase